MKMAGKRKSPKLRRKDKCYVANIYKPDGSRTTISFGRDDERTEGQIYGAFGKWLDLYKKHPHKTLSYGSPYEAITEMTNPTTIRTVGQAYDAYERWAEQNTLPLRDGRSSPELLQIGRCKKFLEPYRKWTTIDFGPDELRAIQEEMVAYRYIRTQRAKSKDPPEQIAYTRTSINRLVNQIRKMWQWAMAREIVRNSGARSCDTRDWLEGVLRNVAILSKSWCENAVTAAVIPLCNNQVVKIHCGQSDEKGKEDD